MLLFNLNEDFWLIFDILTKIPFWHVKFQDSHRHYGAPMMTKNNYWGFPNSLCKFINKQWIETKSSSSSNLKSINGPDQPVEEERKILSREIHYLPLDWNSYLCFKKRSFNASKSRKDLTNTLKNYNEKILENFVTEVDKKQTKTDPLYNQSELVNYVTKIIVSRPKYHMRHCKCQVGEIRDSKTKGTCSVEEPKTQKSGKKCASGDALLSRKQIDLKTLAECISTKIQTDSWNKVGSSSSCPGNESKIGKTVDTQTSANEMLLKIHQFGPSKKNKKKKQAKSVLSDTMVTENISSLDGKTSNKKNYSKIRNEPQSKRRTEPKPWHTTNGYVYKSDFGGQAKKEDCQVSSELDTVVQVSTCSSQEESKLMYRELKKDVAPKEDIKDEGPPKNVKGKTKSNEGVTCNKCRRLKRGYDSSGHNNIIVSNCPQSHGTVLIKMGSNDTSRQFDRIMAELNYQKGEIKRLKNMYQTMEKKNGSQKFTGSRSLSTIYKGVKRPNSIQREISMDSEKGHVKLFDGRSMASTDKDYHEEEMQISRLRPQTNDADADIETDNGGVQTNEAKRKFRCRVLVWLKKSWINLKHRSEECRRNCKENDVRVYISQVFNFCQNTAKGAAMGTWKFVRKKFQ